MYRQPRVVVPALAALCIVIVGVSAGEQNQGDRFAGVELTTVPVAGQVHMVQRPGGGGNVGVFAGPDGVLLVDSLFEPLAERLVAAVRRVSAGEIRFLINTHVHPDHIGGNEPLAGMDVLVLAHDNVRVRALARLRTPRRGGRFAPQPPAGARPVVTYDSAASFHFNGEQVRAFLAPAAHTDGDTFVHFPDSDVLHPGRCLPHHELSDRRRLQRRDGGGHDRGARDGDRHGGTPDPGDSRSRPARGGP